MDEVQRTAIERWLVKARNDLITCQTMIARNPPISDVACFHAQQCAEKALKAFLVSVDAHVERTHDLPRLIALCAQFDPDFQNLMGNAAELTDYAVTSRYPDDWRDIPLSEAIESVQKAETIVAFVVKKLGLSDSTPL